MKNFIIPIFALLLAWSCSPTKDAGNAEKSRSVQIDSTEYEITIIDSGYDTWYLTNFSPAKDRSNDYYRIQNQVGVSNWNDYVNSSRYQRVIENYIYFDFSKDYGIDVNRKLYWYFKYIEDNYRIRLLK